MKSEDADDLFALFGCKEDDGNIFDEFLVKTVTVSPETETVSQDTETVLPETETGETVVEDVEEDKEVEEDEKPFIPTNPFTKKPRKTKETVKKKALKPFSKTDKFVRTMLRGSGQNSIPSLQSMTDHLNGKTMKISDIGIFAENEESENMILQLVIKDCQVSNTLNTNAPIELANVKSVGVDLLRSRLWQPIVVAEIEETGNVECISGRYRLVALAIIYGTSAKIPVFSYSRKLTQAEGRDAIVYANQSRKPKAIEGATNVVLGAVNGDEANLDDVYKSLATNKKGMLDYATFAVVESKHPVGLDFEVALFKGSRKGGKLTTLSGLRAFWGAAITWNKRMPRQEFDVGLKSAMIFLNQFVAELRSQHGFKAKHHMAISSLTAIGMIIAETDKFSPKQLAVELVALGDCGNWKAETIYENMLDNM